MGGSFILVTTKTRLILLPCLLNLASTNLLWSALSLIFPASVYEGHFQIFHLGEAPEFGNQQVMYLDFHLFLPEDVSFSSDFPLILCVCVYVNLSLDQYLLNSFSLEGYISRRGFMRLAFLELCFFLLSNKWKSGFDSQEESCRV